MVDLSSLKAKYKTLSLKALKGVRSDYNSLLRSSETSETDMQSFLARNSYLLQDRYHVDLIVSKPRCVSCVLDFAMYENTGNYSNWHFLEIKSPCAPVIVRKRGYPCFSSVVTEAIGQVKQFKTEMDTCQGLMIRRFPFVRFSFYTIIIGRSTTLQPSDRDFLKDMNQSMAEIRVRTYDSISHELDRLVKSAPRHLGLVDALTYGEYLSVTKDENLFYACAGGDVDRVLEHLASETSRLADRNTPVSWPLRSVATSDASAVLKRGLSLLMTLKEIDSGSLSPDVLDPFTLVGTIDLRTLLDARLVERAGLRAVRLTPAGKELLDEFS
jgi:hypothetical protein